MPLIDIESVKSHQFTSPVLEEKITASFITSAELKFLVPILTNQLYNDILENPSLYSNLINKYIAPCLIDYSRLLFYNQYIADNEILSVPDLLRRDVLNDLSASASFKLKVLTDHLKTGIYHFYTDPVASSKTISGFLISKSPVPSVSPYAKVRIVIPAEGATFETYWDDSSWFPNYIDSEWNYDFNAFLQSLGTFVVAWGDGSQETVPFYYQSYRHTYKTAGVYIITVFSIYAFFSNETVNSIAYLFRLKNLNLNNSTNLLAPPSLSGLTYLQVLNLRATGITSPPVLSGLKALQYLDLAFTQIEIPPILTGLALVRSIQLFSCTSLSTPPVLSGLTNLQYLNINSTIIVQEGLDQILTTLIDPAFNSLVSIDIRVSGGITPTGSLITDFIAAHPNAVLYTN